MKKGKLLAVLVVAIMFISLMGNFSVLADLSGTNILTNGDFETVVTEEGVTSPANWSLSGTDATWNEAKFPQTGGVDGGKYIYINSTSSVSTSPKVKNLVKGSTLKLNLYVKTSAANKASLEIFYYQDDNGVSERKSESVPILAFSHTNGQWQKVSRTIYLPNDASQMQITLRAKDTTYVSFDNLSLYYVDNLLVNGNFEQTLNSVTPEGWLTNMTVDWGTSTSVSLVSGIEGANGNCVAITHTGTNVYALQESSPLVAGKAYKLSFRYMTNSASGYPRIQVGTGNTTNLGAEFNGSSFKPGKDVWMNYTVYFTMFQTHRGAIYLKNNASGTTNYYDDITLEPVETNISYLSTSPVSMTGSSTLVPYEYVIGSELEAVQSGDVYVHYIMNTKSENMTFTGLACVFEYKNDGKKLIGVTPVTATATLSGSTYAPGIGTAKVTVPESTSDATYKVEAFVWDGVSTMIPYRIKSTLQ